MRLIATADWHGEFPDEIGDGLPEGDVLVIGGDVMPVHDHNRQYQAEWFRTYFIPHLEILTARFEAIVWVAGNHDFVLQDSSRLTRSLPDRVVYLQDESYWHEDVHFHEAYGTSTLGPTTVTNVSLMDSHYRPVHPAVVLEL